MTTVYFVRHAKPVHGHKDDRTRPLTEEGIRDSEAVLEVLKDKRIDVFLCSPYKRSLQTIQSTAEYFHKEIFIDERFRERECGIDGNGSDGFKKRWADKDYHEEGGESIHMVQKRNVAALKEALQKYQDKCLVIGTHGTALSSIINYYMPSFGVEDFLRIIDWMPYVLEMQFNGQESIGMTEIVHIYKEYVKETPNQ
ncbi:MAG: histidine phosphatase family protein [Butyrivibrio sp.]|nr:histidine phosphatase family protein [Butyrivibrio sp.]